ncbi:hypothetical protein Ae201684_009060 [Aphanomyces euteiches]|uniref:AB hydrolase-1 domain-containing protein n=1 Tax=Aphanomyces euteiches TaxID=100861 RepID=A0A6G0X2R6_9STRA|nr:hypothetical protein Ae201684_009060 [Aphanomyces euteiches]
MYSLASQMVVARPSLVTIPDLYGQGIQMLPAEVFLGSSFGGPFNILRFRYNAQKQTLRESAEDLLEVLHSIKPHTALEPCFFVTHGYGALVLRNRKHFDPSTGRTFARGLSWCQPTKAWRAHVARDELLTLQGVDLDMRLGKLPHLTRALIVAGTRAIPMPWTTRPVHDQLWDGQIAVAETQMPGEYRHVTVGAPHNLVMMHPATLLLLRDFLA